MHMLYWEALLLNCVALQALQVVCSTGREELLRIATSALRAAPDSIVYFRKKRLERGL